MIITIKKLLNSLYDLINDYSDSVHECILKSKKILMCGMQSQNYIKLFKVLFYNIGFKSTFVWIFIIVLLIYIKNLIHNLIKSPNKYYFT